MYSCRHSIVEVEVEVEVEFEFEVEVEVGQLMKRNLSDDVVILILSLSNPLSIAL